MTAATRRLLIIGNWKMNLNRQQSVALTEELVEPASHLSQIDWAVCPPFVYLETVGQVLRGSNIALGAQDMYHEDDGAFTGEISARMLRDLGCQFVILGHSERRHIMGETDGEIRHKVLAAHSAQLTPIVCVGETLDQRQAGTTLATIQTQFEGSLGGLSEDQMVSTVIAYEPVWAIGTGKVATPVEAAAVHSDLRKMIASRYNADISEAVRIEYGGSVKPDNASELLGCADIDGALVGGASLNATSFLGIATAENT